MHDLEPPAGDVATTWRADRNRYADDPAYRHRVEQFITRLINGGSISDARVLTDQTGARVLVTWTRFYADGTARHRWQPAEVAVPIPEGTTLP